MEACQRPGFLDRPHEQAIEGGGRGAVQHEADVVVGGNGRYAEQGLAVRPAVAASERPLMRQERRASHKEQREGREADISHRVVAVARRRLALVRQTGADRTQLGNQLPDDTHVDVESRSESRCKEELPECWGGHPFAYNMWQIGLSPGTTRFWSAPLGHATRADSERDSIALRTAEAAA